MQIMSLKLLHKGSEDERRWKIIDVSRKADRKYLPQLHVRLTSNETLENKRHIVRALANIASDDSIPILLDVFRSSSGLILGEFCRAFANLGLNQVIDDIEALLQHNESFVRQEAMSALKKLGDSG